MEQFECGAIWWYYLEILDNELIIHKMNSFKDNIVLNSLIVIKIKSILKFHFFTWKYNCSSTNPRYNIKIGCRRNNGVNRNSVSPITWSFIDYFTFFVEVKGGSFRVKNVFLTIVPHPFVREMPQCLGIFCKKVIF